MFYIKKIEEIAGIDRRKEYLKASSSFIPTRRDDINVKPLLEIPGKIAMPWNKPIIIAS